MVDSEFRMWESAWSETWTTCSHISNSSYHEFQRNLLNIENLTIPKYWPSYSASQWKWLFSTFRYIITPAFTSVRGFPSICAAWAYSGDKHALLKIMANELRKRNPSAMRQRGGYCCFISKTPQVFCVCHLLPCACMPPAPEGVLIQESQAIKKYWGTRESLKEKLKQIPHTCAKTPPKIAIFFSDSYSNECVKNQMSQDTCHAWLMFADKFSKILILEHDSMETQYSEQRIKPQCR